MSKKQLLFILFFALCNCIVQAQYRPIVIQHGGSIGDHSEYYPPADMPEVYYPRLNTVVTALVSLAFAIEISCAAVLRVISNTSLMLLNESQVRLTVISALTLSNFLIISSCLAEKSANPSIQMRTPEAKELLSSLSSAI